MAGGQISSSERLKLWVRGGGRCYICRRYLIESQLTGREFTFGEAAHIIGRRATAASPRGLDTSDDGMNRDNADNLILLCDDEHDEIDKVGSRDTFTVDFLRELKRKHEDRVHLATGFADYQRTTPLRMLGALRGKPVEVGRDAVATAVMACAGRMPKFDLSTRNAVEIDLRNLPGEDAPTIQYYDTARSMIDRIVHHKIAEAIANDEIVHLSVFAFARLPLLIHLGAQLDDTVPVQIYQKHRASEGWQWPDPHARLTFDIAMPAPSPLDDEAVLIMNLSGTIHSGELPPAVRHLALYELKVASLPHPDILGGPLALDDFTTAVRKLLASLEANEHKHIRLFHVFAAIPMSAAVSFGRVFADEVHPALQLYDRTLQGDYVPSFQVGTR